MRGEPAKGYERGNIAVVKLFTRCAAAVRSAVFQAVLNDCVANRRSRYTRTFTALTRRPGPSCRCLPRHCDDSEVVYD